MHIWNMNKINDLAALPFSEQASGRTAALFVPQHAFCAQVKQSGKVFARGVS
jgi:hypothetical protein